ncbi:tetratricopeptide repeat protein [Candidatus Leptofilum sp.]|uniref:tetratricopeptide repeat protein n=1 Tax=Candidatus Leptofilum sp. TaxID=3241576 RepID=UPI003B5C6A4E
MSEDFLAFVAELQRQIDYSFNLAEIKTLCLDIGIDYEHIAGVSKLPKIQNLILHMAMRGQADDLVRACHRNRPRFSWPEAPPVVEQIRQAQLMEEQASPQKEAQPPLFIGVPSMPNRFLGRDGLIQRLTEQLTKRAGRTVSAEGLPGVGKTTIAVALAHVKDIQEHFNDGVLWAGLGPQANVTSILNLWADALAVRVSQKMSDHERKVAIKNAIGQRAFLLIIDDAWEIEAAELLKCGGPNCCHFVTTRSKDLAYKVASQDAVLYIPTLDKASAYHLLCSMAKATCEANPAAAKALVAAVGELPLAIELLGGYLGETRRSLRPRLREKALADMAEATKRLQQAQRRLGSNSGQKETLAEAILLSLEGLQAEEDGEEAIKAFYTLGAFAPKPALFSWEAAVAVSNYEEDMIAWLVERNLLEEIDEQLAIHQTISDVAQTKLETAVTDQHRNHYLEIVNKDREDWQTIQRIYDQLQWAWQNTAENESLFDLAEALKIYQKRQGLRQDSIHWYQRSLAIARSNKLRQEESKILNDLGEVYISIGQPDTALDYYNQALPLLEEIGDRAGLATILNNIGQLYFRVGQRDQALDYYNRATPIREEIGDQTGLATTLSNIGLVYDRQGHRDKALDHYNRALAIQEGSSDRTGLAITLSRIGGNYNNRHQPKKALVYCKQALTIQEEVGDLQEMGNTLTSIGIAYYGLGQSDKVLDYYNRALRIAKEMDDRPSEGALLSNIGSTYNNLGQLDKALDCFNQALAIHRAVVFRSFEAYTLRSIGTVYRKLGQPNEAKNYFNQALPVYEEVGDLDGERTTRWWLAQLYHAEGNFTEAAKEMSQAIKLAELIKSPALDQMQEFLTEIQDQFPS